MYIWIYVHWEKNVLCIFYPAFIISKQTQHFYVLRMGDASDKPFSYVSHAINPFYATGKSLKKCVREVL